MESRVAAWQLDMFGDSSPVFTPVIRPDPLPDPHLWSASVREQMVEELMWLACDSRRGDKMPESLMDCADLLSERLLNRKVDVADYRATLGWIMGYWDGALPYESVCRLNRIKPRCMRDAILGTPLLLRDLQEVERMYFGTLL